MRSDHDQISALFVGGPENLAIRLARDDDFRNISKRPRVTADERFQAVTHLTTVVGSDGRETIRPEGDDWFEH